MAYKDVPNNFNPSVIVLAAAAGIFGYWLYRKDDPKPGNF